MPAVLVAGCIMIVGWQLLFFRNPAALDKSYFLRASSGMHQQQRFLYFYYYLGLYPVATERNNNLLDYSVAGAEHELAEFGNYLRTEVGHTTRFGELGKIFLFLPSVYARGSPRKSSMAPCHVMIFAMTLVLLFAAFWQIRQPALGFFTVLLMGSNPFQLFELYVRQNNVFAWPIITSLLILAIHLPLLTRRKPSRRRLWAAPLMTGLLLSSIRQIRTEPVAIIMSAALTYFALDRKPWKIKIALASTLVFAFAGGSAFWTSWFTQKIRLADTVVKEAGGRVYPGPRVHHHHVWHSIWCGLGDFDTTYGYEWNDAAAFQYAAPILRLKHGPTSMHWDEAATYYKRMEELPGYYAVVRDHVLDTVRNDPLWYMEIISRRVWRILTETTPISVAVLKWRCSVPVSGLIVLPVLCLLLWTRNWLSLKLVVFLLPASATALLIYSGRGTCLYSIFHIMTSALILTWILEGLLWSLKIPNRNM